MACRHGRGTRGAHVHPGRTPPIGCGYHVGPVERGLTSCGEMGCHPIENRHARDEVERLRPSFNRSMWTTRNEGIVLEPGSPSWRLGKAQVGGSIPPCGS